MAEEPALRNAETGSHPPSHTPSLRRYGLVAQGGSSYIDSMVLRDRDDNGGGGWSGASDGTLEARIYYCQNWRADVSAILSAAGVVKEWVKYSSYGVPTAIDPGDFDRDGYVTGDDNTAFDDAYTNGRPKADLDFDGYVTGDDNTLWDTYYSNGQNLGRGTLSRSDINNRAGYAGYQLDPTFTGSPSGGRSLYHVRHRVLDSGLGRWTRRDPMGYVDGTSTYEYIGSRPIGGYDPLGLYFIWCAKWEPYLFSGRGFYAERYVPGKPGAIFVGAGIALYHWLYVVPGNSGALIETGAVAWADRFFVAFMTKHTLELSARIVASCTQPPDGGLCMTSVSGDVGGPIGSALRLEIFVSAEMTQTLPSGRIVKGREVSSAARFTYDFPLLPSFINPFTTQLTSAHFAGSYWWSCRCCAGLTAAGKWFNDCRP